MITLVTGTPGAGKTAYVVSELLSLDQTRPVFVHAIPNLKLPHERIFCRSDLCEVCTASPKSGEVQYVEDWRQWAPEGSILVLDEVQRIWRPRASTAAVPDSVAGLETHRHKGLDFFLISQGPHLFDSNARRLVGRHIHLVAKWAGRYLYEWPECQGDTGSTTGAVKRSYKLPAKVFELYQSSTLHTKQDHTKPLAFYLIWAALLAALVLGWVMYRRVSSAIHGDEDNPVLDAAPPPAPAPSTASPPVANRLNPVPDFTPRNPGRIESAPAYDGTYQVKPAPVLVAGVYDGKKCTLFAKGGRRYPTTKEFCIAYVRGEVDYQFQAIPIKQATIQPLQGETAGGRASGPPAVQPERIESRADR